MNDINIFFNNRVVVLTGKGKNDGQNYCFEDKKALARRLEQFDRSDIERLYIIYPDIHELFGYVKGCFKYVEAAGGLVTRADGRLLFIKRLGKWDLPKGKAEKGEELSHTALREVIEECGLKGSLYITGELAHTYHTYRLKEDNILKHTAWFAMRYDGNEELIPQTDENITEAAWLHENLLNVVSQNTYSSIKQVLSVVSN